MATIEVRAVPTLRGAQLRRDIFRGVLPGGTLASALAMGFFKVGEKGFLTQPGGVQIPNNPDNTGLGYSTLDDLVAQNTGVGDRVFQKSLIPGAFTTMGTSTLNIACSLLLTDANLVPDLQLFEIGVFIPAIAGYTFTNPILFAYGTFPKEAKNITIAMTHNVQITF